MAKSDWEVITGDCLQILPTLAPGSVEAVVTSPPYNTLATAHDRGGMHSGNGWLDKAKYSDDLPEADYQQQQRDVFRELRRVCRGTVWINHKARFRDGFGIHPLSIYGMDDLFAEIIWDRGVSMVLNAGRFAHSHEAVYGYGRPVWWDADQNTQMTVWRITPERGRNDHPCPFPMELASRLIRASVPPGGLVLDPYCGSGTTLAAARKLGRLAIGIEQDERYAAIARRRIADAGFPLLEMDNGKIQTR